MNTHEEIANKAKEKGICKDWYYRIKNSTDIKTLVNMFFLGSDWSLEYNFPPRDVISKHKKHSVFGNMGMYIDDDIKLENPNKIALFGNTKADISLNGYTIVEEIILRDKSKADIKLKDNCIAYITVMDNAEANIYVDDMAYCYVRYRGDKCTIKSNENNIVIRELSWR